MGEGRGRETQDGKLNKSIIIQTYDAPRLKEVLDDIFMRLNMDVKTELISEPYGRDLTRQSVKIIKYS